MSIEFDNKFRKVNKWYREYRYKNRTTPEHMTNVKYTFNAIMELLFYACNDLKQWKGLNVSSEFDKKNEQFNKWYESNKSNERDIKMDIKFLMTCADEILYQLAFACRDIRRLESRQIDPFIITPNLMETGKGL